MVEIKYSCIATPPDEISAEKKYLFGHDSKGYFYADNKDKHYSDIDVIKMLFKPVKADWSSVLKAEARNTKIEKPEKNG